MATTTRSITVHDSFQALQLQGYLPSEQLLAHQRKQKYVSAVKKQGRSLSVETLPSDRRASITQLRLAYYQPEPKKVKSTSSLPFLTELYVSPHPDDICYSCFGKVYKGDKQDELKDNASTSRMIVTVFSKSRCCNGHLGEKLKRNVEDITTIRRNEDEAFASSVGCKLIQLGLSDSSARDEFSRREELAIQSKVEQTRATKAHPTYTKVQNALTDILRWAVQCKAAIYMPMGIGCHIDHLMTRVATESILEDIRKESITATLPVQVTYFEDLPYATYQTNETIEKMASIVVASAKIKEQLVQLDQKVWSQKTRAVEGYVTQMKPTILPSLESRAAALAPQSEQNGRQLRERVWILAPGEWKGGF